MLFVESVICTAVVWARVLIASIVLLLTCMWLCIRCVYNSLKIQIMQLIHVMSKVCVYCQL
uniref:Uncharacterized protein n=1 Tax=Octopus bimaculoides TaxID=37653 RepID=A0A0L8FH04_OCTBM